MDALVFILLGTFFILRGMEKVISQPEEKVTENLEIRLNPLMYKDEEAFTKLRKEILERGHI